MTTIKGKSDVTLRWPEQQSLLGEYRMYGGVGSVSYAARLNPSRIPAWRLASGKIGFGLGRFGYGAFGYGDGGVGFGFGGFGLGAFGFGTPMIEHVLSDLIDGTWHFAVVGVDPAGNEVTPAVVTASVALSAAPEPPGIPTADGYDEGTDTLTVSWALSPDDE